MDESIYDRIDQLTKRIDELARQQKGISQQLVQLINELEALKRSVESGETKPAITKVQPAWQPKSTASTVVSTIIETPKSTPQTPSLPNRSFEEFIGKNLASKVGILVTIIGIFIGAKYAIEHGMVSERVRIMAGYLSGLALAAVAIKLKPKYEAYSAVLMGGGLAVLYFITYIAYSAYELLPQIPAFGVMLVCTVATVSAALWYNRVVIAHLGLVGAYAIPFLLSNNSGQYAVLFAYIGIINAGILVVSFQRYWKSLFYASFLATWFIYLFWYVMSTGSHLTLAWTWLSIYFLIFYATFLSYKLIKKEKYSIMDVVVLLGNAFAFYGIGYALLDEGGQINHYSGAFTLGNAAIHLVISQIIRRLQLADKAVYYLILGLVIVFCTIAVPVQLDGNWVTLLWTAEAVLVFVIGRRRNAPAYEKLGVALVLLGFASLLEDLTTPPIYSAGPNIILLLTGILVAIMQGAIIYVNRKFKTDNTQTIFSGFYDFAMPVVFLATCYLSVEMELFRYFSRVTFETHYTQYGRMEIDNVAFMTQVLYTMVFVNVVAFVNQRWVRNALLASFMVGGMVLLMAVLLLQGLEILNDLTRLYQTGDTYFGGINFALRYIAIGVVAWSLWLAKKAIDTLLPQRGLKQAWGLAVHVMSLAFISAEYLCWATVAQYKLGLSVVWGMYALFLTVRGIRYKQKHVRLAAIVLFSVTLVKLFFYDLADAGTITKTVSFISLGVILLVVSFLYNKYKDAL